MHLPPTHGTLLGHGLQDGPHAAAVVQVVQTPSTHTAPTAQPDSPSQATHAEPSLLQKRPLATQLSQLGPHAVEDVQGAQAPPSQRAPFGQLVEVQRQPPLTQSGRSEGH